MKIERFIKLDNGFIADLGTNIEITISCYKILVCVDINITNYDNDINILPCYVVIVPIKELYLPNKNTRFIVKEIDYEK